MSLLQPLGLLGLLALPVIVVLHLLHDRNRYAVVPSLALWRWLERQVRGPRLRRPPITAVLLLQLAAAALLSLALARPRLDVLAGPAVFQRLILVVDTSTSMSAADAAPSRLGRAQSQAALLLAGLGENDSAVLISAGAHPRIHSDSRHAGLTGLLSALTALQPAGVGQDWPAAFSLAAAAVLPDRHNRLVILTDGAFDFPETLAAADYPYAVEWVRVGSPQANQAIVTLSARPTGSGATQVFARLANFSDRAAERTVSLQVDGQPFDTHTARLAAGGTLGQVWTLPPGAGAVEIALGGSDALPADDHAALGLLDARPVEALLVTPDPNPATPDVVERALRSIPGLRLSVVAPADYLPFEVRDLTVFDGWLPTDWPAGGVLVFNPPANSSLLPVSALQAVRAVAPTPGEALFADVEFNLVTFGSAVILAQPGAAWLAPALSDSDGLGLVWRGASGLSRVVLFAFALEETNLTRRAGFPILVANAVAEVLPPALPTGLRPGDPLPLPAPDLYPTLTVTDPSGQVFDLGPDRPASFTATALAGLYRVEGSLANGQTWRGVVGVNPGALEESDLRQPVEPAFTAQLDRAPANPSLGLELWPLLAALAAVVLLVEARLAWR
jgi:hypothetical protein